MRKIEHEMVAALKDGRKWKKSNTMVTEDGFIFLFENLIAYKLGGVGPLEIHEPVVRHWPTKTTFSRLKALGFHDLSQFKK